MASQWDRLLNNTLQLPLYMSVKTEHKAQFRRGTSAYEMKTNKMKDKKLPWARRCVHKSSKNFNKFAHNSWLYKLAVYMNRGIRKTECG